MFSFIKEDPVNHIFIIIWTFLGFPFCAFMVAEWLTRQKAFIASDCGLGVGLCVYYGVWLGLGFVIDQILEIYDAFKS